MIHSKDLIILYAIKFATAHKEHSFPLLCNSNLRETGTFLTFAVQMQGPVWDGGRPLQLQGHQDRGEEGEDVDEVGPDGEGAGGPGEGADPGRAHGVRV